MCFVLPFACEATSGLEPGRFEKVRERRNEDRNHWHGKQQEMESQAIEAMTTGGQACRTADVGSGISVEAAISQVSISLHSITSAASASQSHFGKRFASVNARTPNGAGRRDCRQTLSACADLGNKITEEV